MTTRPRIVTRKVGHLRSLIQKIITYGADAILPDDLPDDCDKAKFIERSRKLLSRHSKASDFIANPDLCGICQVGENNANGKGIVCQSCYSVLWRVFNAVASKKSYTKKSRTPQGRYNLLKGEAKNRGLELTIDFRQFSEMLERPCHYCGIDGSSDHTGSRLDRVDFRKGYLSDNVLPACGRCNRARANWFTPTEFKAMMKLLLKLRETNPPALGEVVSSGIENHSIVRDNPQTDDVGKD